MNIPVPNFIETKAIFSQECGCDSYRNDNIRRDCYWYHCEHQMGASIDCCTLEDSLGDCPCSDDCHDYMSRKEVTKRLKALSAFKSYFDSLYGQGLEVVNWHLNGVTEPFDNFYDSAMEEYENA